MYPNTTKYEPNTFILRIVFFPYLGADIERHTK